MSDENHHSENSEHAPIVNGANPPGVIEQVRELLFGETMEARFSELETRLTELRSDSEHAQASAIDGIGEAIAHLGANIREMSAKRKSA